MNPCERVESLLSAYQDQETSPAETRYVAGHLTACKRCRAAAQDLEVLRRRLALLPSTTVSEGFTARVMDAALGRKPAGLDEPVVPPAPGAWSAWGPPLQAAAVLALAVFLGMQWLSGRDAAVPVAQSPVQEAIDAAEVGESQTATPVQTTSLDEALPEVREPAANPTSIGLANQELVLEDWALATPQGGGQPVLTRVGADASDRKVVVTY